MLNEFIKIINFIFEHLIKVWPYLLITIPVAVAVRMTGASKYINKAFNKQPIVAIFLATVVGAFSPFCSCTVIPIIASMLIGGVPLAPVMSFWLASPSMDPEIFFLSVTMIGWKLAVWRLVSTFLMSLFAGIVTHFLVQKKWVKNEDTLKAHSYNNSKSKWIIIKNIFNGIRAKMFLPKLLCQQARLEFADAGNESLNTSCCSSSKDSIQTELIMDNACCSEKENNNSSTKSLSENYCGCSESSKEEKNISVNDSSKTSCCDKSKKESDNIISNDLQLSCCGNSNQVKSNSFAKIIDEKFLNKLSKEAYNASMMVLKFMVLAYFLEALIVFYVPSELIKLFLGKNQFLSIILAALMGIPIYTSTMPALALVGGLLIQGMTPAAALAFLISGPTTTVPAMAAVWNLANRRVFLLYVGFTLAGAIISGLFYYVTYSIF